MKHLLLTTKQVEEILGVSYKSFKSFKNFPKPVNITTGIYYPEKFARNLYKYSEIKKWVKSLH